MSKKAIGVLLTETELELMNILWGLESATVREVLAGLPKGREMAYTSASTIIRILEKKGVVSSLKEGKTHIYKPLLKKEAYEKKTLYHVVNNVFDGTPSGLVRRLIKDTKLSPEELKEIKDLIGEI
ncbi:MAG: BlaI/MecI/CopY family transcriptional regulator [Bdellovibrionales bacterium]